MSAGLDVRKEWGQLEHSAEAIVERLVLGFAADALTD